MAMWKRVFKACLVLALVTVSTITVGANNYRVGEVLAPPPPITISSESNDSDVEAVTTLDSIDLIQSSDQTLNMSTYNVPNTVFHYTGDYEYVEYAAGKFYAKLLTDGVFTLLNDIVLDVFLVGGGGSGWTGRSRENGGGGGGGGYTLTVRNQYLSKSQTVDVDIGYGGADADCEWLPNPNGGWMKDYNGAPTTFGGIYVSGGQHGHSISEYDYAKGGNGGSGGSGHGYAGSNGGSSSNTYWYAVGHGQGSTTYAFEGDYWPFNTMLFSGGGGVGALGDSWEDTRGGAGGDGGGGAGGNVLGGPSEDKNGRNGIINSGGGGGGGAAKAGEGNFWGQGGFGGSGVVIVRGDTKPPNTAPSAPPSITSPANIQSNTDITVSWGVAQDADNNLSGYIVECNRNSAGFSQIYQGSLTSLTYSVPLGTTSLQFRVKAYDTEWLESPYTMESIKSVSKATQAPLSVSNPGAKTWGNPSFTLSATGGSGSGALSYSVASGTDVIGISGNTVTIKKAGTATVTVTKASDTNYNAITSSAITITVSPRNISNASISITSAHTYTGVAQTPSFNLTDSVTITTADRTVSCTNNTNAGTATLTLTGQGNYTGTKSQTFVIAKKSLTVTADAKSIVYGSAKPTFTASYSGFVNGQTTSVLSGDPAYTCSYAVKSPVGSYTITPSVGTLSASNYSFSYTVGTLTVTKKSVTISGMKVFNKTYDGSRYLTIDSTDAVVSGNLDNTNLTIDISQAVAVADTAKVGTRNVTFSGVVLSGNVVSNYSLTTQPPSVNVEISKRQMQVSNPLVKPYKVYDGTRIAFVEPGEPLNAILTDSVNVALQVAEYNDANTRAANKILVEYTLQGDDAYNYVKPASQVFAGKIVKDEPNVIWPVLGPLRYGNTLKSLDLSTGSGDGYFTWGIPGYKPTVEESGSRLQLTFYPNDDENYLSVTKMLELTVLPKDIGLEGITAQDKVYDGGNSVMLDVSSAVLVGNLDGENLKLDSTQAKGELLDYTAGVNKLIELSGFTLNGTARNNYIINYPTDLAITIARLQLQVEEPIVETSKEYDGNTKAKVTAGKLVNIAGDDDVLLSAEAEYNDSKVTAATHITVEYTLSGTDADNYRVPAGLEVPLEK